MLDSATFNRTLFFPRRDTTAPPPEAFDVSVSVPEAALHLRVHAAPGALATVLLFHGNGEVVADYDAAAALFADIGASLAVVDYRGYGDSTGTPSLRTIIEDAHAVLAALVARTQGAIVVMGRSLGSACAIELYGAGPARVAGFVLESGFCKLERLAQRRGLQLSRHAPIEAIFDPLPKLHRGTHPLLVMHGARDTLILPDEAEAAFAAAGSREKTHVVIEDRGHNDISHAPAYWSALARFVKVSAAGAQATQR